MAGTISWNWFRLAFVVFAASFFLTLFSFQPLEAHDNGWRWDFPTDPIIVQNQTTLYASAVAEVATAYDAQTDLTVTSCSSSSVCGTLVFVEGNYGVRW